MNKTKILLLSSLLLITACNTQVADKTNPQNVTLKYPADWIEDANYLPSQSKETLVYRKKDSSDEQTQIILKSTIANENNATLQAYFDSQYQECQDQNPENEEYEKLNSDSDYANDVLYIPCFSEDLSNPKEWTKKEIDGVTTYRSTVRGIPESGEEEEVIYVPLDKKIIVIQAVYNAPQVDKRERQVKEVQEILDTISIN